MTDVITLAELLLIVLSIALVVLQLRRMRRRKDAEKEE